MKEARDYRDRAYLHRTARPTDTSIRSVDVAISKWLDICEKEGRDGRDPVTDYTHKSYTYRAGIMRAYAWDKELADLQTPDVIEFRSWLLKNHSRDLAKKVLSSFHSVIREMAVRGHISSNVAAGVSVRADSRYDTPVQIPTPREVADLLQAADSLANSKNKQIADSWKRYRPMLSLASYRCLVKSVLRSGGALPNS